VDRNCQVIPGFIWSDCFGRCSVVETTRHFRQLINFQTRRKDNFLPSTGPFIYVAVRFLEPGTENSSTIIGIIFKLCLCVTRSQDRSVLSVVLRKYTAHRFVCYLTTLCQLKWLFSVEQNEGRNRAWLSTIPNFVWTHRGIPRIAPVTIADCPAATGTRYLAKGKVVPGSKYHAMNTYGGVEV
jgi:hypothetical protein